ncbi:TOBE domain-containing protein [Microbacterium sp. KR10-403]|uniref:TOBE domain-containing protein n=1 Tax=Microbacterium sp. KR10-403 TaxID=3158581 RepID=UPI0032E383B5
MKTSARNRLSGTVTSVTEGAVNDVVDLEVGDGITVSAVVTHGSTQRLGLAAGVEATALIKAPWVVLVTDAEGLLFSARNRYDGTVTRVERGAVNATIDLEIAGGRTIVAVVTNEGVDELGLAAGSTATALVKASHVILAVAG